MTHAKAPCAITLLTIAMLSSCANYYNLAGSMQLSPEHPAVLRIECQEPANLQLHIWNRGPKDVHFQEVTDGSGSGRHGVLTAADQEYAWSATTDHLNLLLTTPTDEATIRYVIRSDRAINLHLHSQHNGR